jgi:predicted enzyme related to lactoylglutathione lyase
MRGADVQARWKQCAVALEVDDFPAAVQRMRDRNVKITREAAENQLCFMVLIEDPDGNPIMIHRRKLAGC